MVLLVLFAVDHIHVVSVAEALDETILGLGYCLEAKNLPKVVILRCLQRAPWGCSEAIMPSFDGRSLININCRKIGREPSAPGPGTSTRSL